MKSRTLIKVAGQSIVKNKMRTFLTMLGIIIGVGAVIVMVAIGAGAQNEIASQIENLGTNMLVVTPGAAEQGGVSQGAQSLSRLTVDDAEMLDEQSFLVAAVSPVIVSPTQVIGGTGNWRTAVMGVSTGYQTIRDWGLTDGIFFDDDDVAALRKVVVLGSTVADALFPDGDAVGQQISVRDVPVTVIGVLESKGQTSEGSDQDDVVLAPYTTVQNRLSGRMFISQILASTHTAEEVAAAQAEIGVILRESHDLAQNEQDDFTVRNQAEITEAAQGTTEVMTLLLAAIAGISLLVGGIGIMNIMLVSVTERTREIGLRLALGARGSDVLTQFLVESVVMSIFGGLIGLGLGIGGSATVSYFTGWSTLISPSTVALALCFAGAVGVFFGFYPARRAAALDPIEALRYE
ncbi:ABC transporter permease [Gaopeijia maritima]|uniref:ABC transporter permease n=1 Tax=Gaopeijia maritima TaxID=3119007 RepID=A0ABU9E6G8_9BACT